MTDEQLPTAPVNSEPQPADSKKITVAVDVPTADKMVLCEVCGHANSQNTALCTMCSNYLR